MMENRKSFPEGKKEEIALHYYIMDPPTLNYLINPLNGGYDNLINIEDIIKMKLKMRSKDNLQLKFTELSNSTNCFQLKENLDVFFCGDNFLFICILTNNTSHQIIFNGILVYNESNDKREKINIENVKLPSENTLQNKESIYFSFKLNNVDQDLNIHIKFTYQNVIIEKNHYEILGNGLFNKNFKIKLQKPFEIESQFYHYQMEQYYLRLNIKNNSKFPIIILQIDLLSFSEKIIFSKKYNDNFFLDRNEEISLIFQINTIDNFQVLLKEKYFNLKITWKKSGELNERDYSLKIINNLPLFNQNFILSVKEKPKDKIKVNSIFKIVFTFKSKSDFENIGIQVIQNYQEKEIEILNIQNNLFSCKKDESKDITFICKNFYTGIIFFPTIIFTCDITKKFNKMLEFECEDEGE